MKTITTLILALTLTTGFTQDCITDSTPPVFIPQPPESITVISLDELVLPIINAVDDCSEPTVSYIMDYASNCPTDECYAVEWTAIDSVGNIAIEYTLIYISDPLGIEVHEKEKLSVYPNPSNGTFKVSGSTEYQIFDLSGKRVKQPLEKGMYIIRDNNQSIRLIVE